MFAARMANALYHLIFYYRAPVRLCYHRAKVARKRRRTLTTTARTRVQRWRHRGRDAHDHLILTRQVQTSSSDVISPLAPALSSSGLALSGPLLPHGANNRGRSESICGFDASVEDGRIL